MNQTKQTMRYPRCGEAYTLHTRPVEVGPDTYLQEPTIVTPHGTVTGIAVNHPCPDRRKILFPG